MSGSITPKIDIQGLADAWAKKEGYAAARDVPVARALDLIQHVSDASSVPAAVVRDQIFAAAAVKTEAAKVASDKLGTGATVQAGAAHSPIASAAGFAPVGAKIEALATAKSALSALTSGDRTFRQTVQDFQEARIAITDKVNDRVLDEIALGGARLISLFDQIDADPRNDQIQEEVVKLYSDFVSRAARQKGVFLTKAPPGGLPKLEFLAGAAPSTGGGGPKRQERYQEMSAAALIDGTSEVHEDSPLVLGPVASIAIDAASGTPFVYEVHGKVKELLSIEELVAIRKKTLDKKAKDPELAGSVEELRSLTEKGLQRLSGPVTYVSLLEDAEQKLARVYPTRWHRPDGAVLARRMISDGPFKGIFLDDLINKLGEKSETAFSFDPGRGPGLPTTPKQGEPFVTTATVMERGEKRQKLYVRIPFEHAYTEVRQALRRLSELEPAIKYHEGSKNGGFYFGSESYGAVRDVLRGLVLSEKSLGVLEKHFDELTKVEMAAGDQSLSAHTAKAIGGFKSEVVLENGSTRKVDLSYWQKKSLAWLEARDYKGVLSLGTGMGKTLSAIGMMQELINRHDEKRPFLIVTPPALRGNFAKEIYKFLDEKSAEKLVDRMEVLSYQEFTKAVQSGELNGKAFKPKSYGAVIYDEAQWMKSYASTRTKAALSFVHPRTVCLTASPMEHSPMEAYVLSAVANNINLADPKEGKEHRHRMRKFKDLYCVTLGSRILGVKQRIELLPKVFFDPKHNLYTWVRSNVFYADKKMDDAKLPTFKIHNEVMVMPRSMETAYRKTAKRISNIMRGMVSMYRDKGILKEWVDEKGKTRREINPLAKHEGIPQMFGVKFRGVISDLNAIGNNQAKIERAADLITKRMETNPKSRAVLFSDSTAYCATTAKELSKQIPGKIHVAAMGSEIAFFQNGVELETFGGHDLPFKPREYRKDPSQPADPVTNRDYEKNEWQTFVLNEIIGPNKDMATATLFGPVYQQGQNLQWADTGVHLDRDSWNRENTKQREARLWRRGQKEKVEFYNVDWVYKKAKDNFDRSLDQVRAAHELVEGTLFHDVIEVPQKTFELGQEWSDVRSADSLKIDLNLLELGVSPSIKRAASMPDTAES